MSSYEEAVTTLYQAPLGDFVAERKRLAAELKAAGDKEAATRFAKLARPPVSAWAVNQLWWRERNAFEALLAAASRVLRGEREAGKAHREALASLRDAAQRVLEEAGNAASEVTLRRVTTTLSAIAASGSFAPDPPGALVADRDPPGFEFAGIAGTASAASASTQQAPAGKQASARDQEAERKRQEAEQRRAEQEERERRLAERKRLSAALRDAQKLLETQHADAARLRRELEAAEQSLKKTQTLLADIEEQLANL